MLRPREICPVILLAAIMAGNGSAIAANSRIVSPIAGTYTLAQADTAAPPPRPEDTRAGAGSIDGDSRPLRRHRQQSAVMAEPEAYPGRHGQAEAPKPSRLERQRFAPTVPATAEAPAASTARLSAMSGFTVFRDTVSGTSGGSAVEPTAANDRNGILVTGNFYANTSSDNGLTFASEALDPSADEVYGGFCCDQVAYAVDRGDHSLVFWLIQYRYDARALRNALKLRLFRGRSALLSQADSCNWNFEPNANFKLDYGQWFDFNQVSHTTKYLYITTNVRDANKASDPADASNDPRVGALIFRIPLDDLDDEDCHIEYSYWYEKGEPYISPVQNAGSTMYLAAHVPGLLEGDNLRIYSIADSLLQARQEGQGHLQLR